MRKYTVGSFEDEFIEGFPRKLIIEIPFEILSDKGLALNEKLVLGLDFSLRKKLGFNQMTSKEMGGLLSLHPNIVGSCRKNLVEKGYLVKEGRKYFLIDHYKTVQESVIHDDDKINNGRNIFISRTKNMDPLCHIIALSTKIDDIT